MLAGAVNVPWSGKPILINPLHLHDVKENEMDEVMLKHYQWDS